MMSRRRGYNRSTASVAVTDQEKKSNIVSIRDTVANGMGLLGENTAVALDAFSNLLARTGLGSSSLENGTDYPLTRFSLRYWPIVSMYESSWLFRRVVDAPAEDVMRMWPDVLGDVDPLAVERVKRAVRKTNTKGRMLTTAKWGRLFGGAGALMLIKGHEDRLEEPLELDEIPLGGYKGLLPFDRWSGIMPGSELCGDLDQPLDLGLPEFYDVQLQDGKRNMRVHCSRILRYCGPMMPEPENSVYSQWGISVMAPVMQAMVSYDNVSANALSLSFKANILGVKDEQLAQMLSGVGATQLAQQKFAQRMSQFNEYLSNQSLAIVGKDGEITSTQYSFGGLADIIQMFQLQMAGAAKMPVSLLWGKLYNGLGSANGEADEKLYEKTCASEYDANLRSACDKLFPVIMQSELGEVPKDMELMPASIRVLDEKEKSELAKTTTDTLTVALNSGIISPRKYGQELKAAAPNTGVYGTLTDEDLEKLSDDVSSEGELGMDPFAQGGGEEDSEKSAKPDEAKNLNPASSPTKALKMAEQRENAEDALGKALRMTVRMKASDEDGPGRTVNIHGLDCIIENPAGSVRRGDGWSHVMPYHYGYIKGVKGADGDSLDVSINPVNGEGEGWVYLFDQRYLDRPGFDETKCFLGYASAGDALSAFKEGHHRADEVLMDWTPLPVAAFKEWIKTGDLKRPAMEQL